MELTHRFITYLYHCILITKKGYKTNNIPKALEYYSGALSIPIHYNLKQKDLKKIVGTIKKVIY